MAAPESRYRQPKQLEAGRFQQEISSFRLYLAAEGKAPKTVRNYTEAVQWFAVARLLRETGWTRWEEIRRKDVQEWMVWLLGRYSAAYASNQFRATAVLQMAGGRGRDPRSHGQAEAAARPGPARPGLPRR